jgi:cytochrome c-type biogenesis protein CcmH/NrfG
MERPHLHPTSDEKTIAHLEKLIAAAPDDGIALVRLGAVYERMGATAKAMTSYEAAARANPSNAAPVAHLARLYAKSGDQQKALESAKAARKLSPEDPAIARSLGLIAHQAGDSIWGASLLQEAVRKSPADPELYAETAEVLYNVGQVDEARELMSQVLASPAAEKGVTNKSIAGVTDRARSFLAMTELTMNPAADSETRIQAALKADAQNLPALMALGVNQENKGSIEVARETYLKILGHAPAFTPAKLRLAVIASTESKLDPRALEWARQARAAYPNNAVAAKALGILSQRSGGEPARTIALLQDTLRENSEDAQSLYYMGLAQLLNKQETAGLESLRKAVSLGLAPELMADAAKRLQPQK